MSKRTKSWIAGTVALLAAVATTPLAADAAAKKPAAKTVTISFESYMPALGQPGTDTLEALVGAFQKANPTIKVNLIGDGPGTNITANVQREAAAGQIPDVVQMVFDAHQFAINNLGAQPLEKTIGQKELDALWGGDNPYAPSVRKLGMLNGQTYGIPWTLSTPVMFYNADLFTAAGLDPAKPPTTWKEVQDAAATIKSKTQAEGIVIGCVGAAAGVNDWCLQGIVKSNGGDILTPDNKATTLNGANLVGALQTLQSLNAAGAVQNLTTAQTVQAWGAGKLAMVLQTSALQSTLIGAAGGRFKILNTGMPGFPGKTTAPTNSGSELMIFTKDKAKQKAAWELIKFLTSDASQSTITQNVGYAPLRTTLVKDVRYLKPWAQTQTLVAANIAQLDRVIPWDAYPGPNFVQIEQLFLAAASKVIFDKADAQATMNDAQTQAAGLLK